MAFDQAVRTVIGDRMWFSRHTQARVRFRPERPGEFSPLEAAGHTVPAFIPRILSPATPLSWVAVIELTRALTTDEQADQPSLRIRLRTVPIRSRELQMRLAPLYEKAVVQDFLRHHPTLSSANAA